MEQPELLSKKKRRRSFGTSKRARQRQAQKELQILDKALKEIQQSKQRDAVMDIQFKVKDFFSAFESALEDEQQQVEGEEEQQEQEEQDEDDDSELWNSVPSDTDEEELPEH